jgi:hypothetical protein
MLNLEDNLDTQINYNTQQDWIFRSFGYSTSTVILLDLTRGQVSEVNLLQLIPGFYLLLFFFFFLLLLILSKFFLQIVEKLEIIRDVGVKTLGKFNSSLSAQFSIFFYFFLILLNFQTVIPISLDSFNSYGEKMLENLWSFNEVLNLELVLLFFLSIISQIPTIAKIIFANEKATNLFPRVWKIIILTIVILSGFLTPTIDGYTQLSFAFSSVSLYILFLIFLKKRSNLKYQGISFFGI